MTGYLKPVSLLSALNIRIGDNMRIYEIANAEDQLVLLRVIIDNTWNAIAQQAERQKLEKINQQNAKKFKPKKTVKSPSIKAVAKPPPPKNTTQNLAQNPINATQVNPSLAPSPQQNATAYRGYFQQDQQDQQSDLAKNQDQPITSKPPKW
jgi:hypothetical protein